MGRDVGLTEEKLRELGRWSDSDVYSAEERAVLRLADAMCAASVRVEDELYAELARHFGPEQLVELVSALAWENYRARFNRVFEVESEDYSEGAYCPVPMTPGQAGGAEEGR